MKILGIETSCDETAAAVVEDGRHILSNVVVSQIDIFAEYGGVIPEVASRSHLEAILPVIKKALNITAQDTTTSSHISSRAQNTVASSHTSSPTLTSSPWSDIDAIAVTHTPGLLGSLLIGTLTARTLAILHDKPLYAVHHLKSHIYANWLTHPEIKFPLLALVISGGHTQILYMTHHNHFEIIGTTRDDAVGECFDKVAKILGLPYPGGPAISKAAQTGSPTKYPFPHPQVENLDFSFSGLKTAVLREVQKSVNKPISFPSHELAPLLTPQMVSDFAASFEHTAVDILLEKLAKALETHPAESIVIAGGVSANSFLRTTATQKFDHVFFPEPSLSGDNAAMVAAAAYYEIQSGIAPTDPYHLNIAPRSAIS